jgi:hypothetical protein
MNKEITLEDVQKYCLEHFSDFMETTDFNGKTHFQEGGHHYSFCRFADFLIAEGFRKNDEKLIQHLADYTVLLLEKGDYSVRNGVYVSFIESLVDRSYKYPHLKGFIQQMPEDVRTFIKGFFIDEVLESLDLKRNEAK